VAKLAAGGSIPVNSSLVGPVFLSGAAGGVAPAADDDGPMSVIPVIFFLNAYAFQAKIKQQSVFDGPISTLFSIGLTTNIYRKFCALLHLQYVQYMGKMFALLNKKKDTIQTTDEIILQERTRKFHNALFTFQMVQLPNTQTNSMIAVYFKDAIVIPVIDREYNGKLPDAFFEGRNIEGARLMFDIWLSIKLQH
jgi:hypothetical protein